MNDNRLRFYCQRSPYSDDIKLHVATGHPVNGIAKPLEFEAHQPGHLAPDTPALTMQQEAAQELIDVLWGAGLRPTQGKQSEGVTAAQGRHLEDMRALAFGKLNIDAPTL